MAGAFANRQFRRLFSAQVSSLVSTGLLTVALGLLAHDLAGEEAGLVLGTALTIKMVAYVVISPLMATLLARLRRTPVLIVADIVRLGIAACLPWVDQVWQIYLLIFFLQSASATFTPTFQAVIAQVLPRERDYTQGLSLSRLAYDLEALVSPLITAALLTVMSFHWLFLLTALGFGVSAVFVRLSALGSIDSTSARWHEPGPPDAPARTGFWRRLGAGVVIFVSTPALRGLLAMYLVVAAGHAMVLVNSVVISQELLGRGSSGLALLLAATGLGSLLVAMSTPALLTHFTDRTMMLAGSFGLPITMLLAAAALAAAGESAGQHHEPIWWSMLVLWFLIGAAVSAVLTPAGRLLRRAAEPAETPAVFAANFSLSHLCYLVTYPLAGWLGMQVGLASTAVILAIIGLTAVAAARWLWPRHRLGNRRPGRKQARRTARGQEAR